MRLPRSAHTTRPWRIHELAPDFRVEDVWSLPTPGGPDDFPRLVEQMTKLDLTRRSSAVRALFAIRWKLGGLLGWDRPNAGLGSRVRTLRERLPADLSGGPSPPSSGGPSPPSPRGLPFTPLYITKDECALEMANQTVHGVLHLGWVPDETGGWHGQMAVLVRRNGVLGDAYMTAIAPFRHLIVYPLMMRGVEEQWRAR